MPMQQAEDFRTESRALSELLAPLSEADFDQVTQFKNWTINDVLGHLHMFNVAADLTLQDGAKFERFFADIAKKLAQGMTLVETQYPWLDGLSGRALYDAWCQGAESLADSYARADPQTRVKWAGPEMSARSSITARQMETWAHGQALFDLLGVEREETDRISNIVFLGVNTFAWSFVNRGLPVPEQMPYLHLTAPSGVIWDWNYPDDANRIEGSARDFARVVTQVRNIADTKLITTGPVAREWMRIAQCFAGKPEQPPAPNSRFISPAP